MESKKDRYFVDGFLIRHFNIFPIGFDKENLFDEQKVFLIYLIGTIPDLDNWAINIDYKIKLDEIKKLDKINVSQTEYDLANIRGTDKAVVYKQQLFLEKKRRIQELNKRFGIEEDEEEIEKTVEIKTDVLDNNPRQLWDMLQGKGLVK